MAQPPVFVDTAALVALTNADDALHKAAVAVQGALARQRVPLVTSDWVLAEFLGHTARPGWRRAGVAAVEALRASPSVSIVAASRRAWADAFAFYRTRPDKGWSLVDCASVLTCQARAIRRVFTHDHHFEQAGFEVMMR